MALQRMFGAVNGSLGTVLAGLVSATVTSIGLEDVGVLAGAPGICTLGDAERCEVIYYEGISGKTLTGCVRGFGGSAAQIWPAGTGVYRAFTAYDHDTFCANLEALEDGKLGAQGDASKVTAKFSVAGQRAQLSSGETLAVALGKVARWYASFGQAAWAAIGTSAGAVAAGDHAHAGYVQLDGAGKVPAAAISAAAVQASASRQLALADAGKCVDTVGSAAVTLTIPLDSAVNFPVDTEIEVSQEGTGAATVAAASGVTLCGIKGSKASFGLAGRYGVAILKKKGANSWRVAGDVQ